MVFILTRTDFAERRPGQPDDLVLARWLAAGIPIALWAPAALRFGS